jgi:preprotein translocase subunit SecA
VHHVNQALKAHKLFMRDRDYIVKAGQVVIIDEFTGRMMQGRRYSEGLHQALEAKEHVDIQPENQTLALDHLPELLPPVQEAGRHDRHGATEANEFMDIYGLDVPRGADQRGRSRAPTSTTRSIAPSRRRAAPSSPRSPTCHRRGQPVLVGTTSIEKSSSCPSCCATAPTSASSASTSRSRPTA